MRKGLALAASFVALFGCALPAIAGAPSAVIRKSPAPYLFGFGRPDPEIQFPFAPLTTERILVRFEPADAARGQEAAVALAAGATRIDRRFTLVPGLYSFEVPPAQVDEVLAKLRNNPRVRYAEPSGRVHIATQTTPWGVTRIHAPEFWSVYGKGTGTKIAVLDTGFDFGHPDLPAPVASMSFIAGETAADVNSHGSHVAGTILALDNDAGVVGVAPELSILVAKVIDDNGYGDWPEIIAGVEWAVAQGAKVINMSFSGSDYSQAMQDAMNAAFAAGALPIAAAGNEFTNTPRYPAFMDNVMSVAAIDANDNPAWFSNYGPTISVAAPGVEVESTVPLGGWEIQWAFQSRPAKHVPGSQSNPRYGRMIYCEYGWFYWSFPSEAAGNIAHIRDSLIFPVDYVIENAWDAGAIAVVLSSDLESGYQPAVTYDHFRPVWYVDKAVGDELIQNDGVNASIVPTAAGHGYNTYDGTSMACPHVVGAAGLLFAQFVPSTGFPDLPPGTVRWVLERTADQPGPGPRNDLYGYGIINAKSAGDYLQGRIQCPGDLNADSLVEDSDFEVFVQAYNELLAPGGPYTGADFNGDGLTDDQDFQIFVQSYDALLCP